MSGGLWYGLSRIARFRADGLAAVPATPQGFLNSLAPWIAFPLVGAVLLILRGAAAEVPRALLGAVIGLTAPPVLSHALAAACGRRAEWLRYAVAFNWAQWAIPVAALGLTVLATVAIGAGLDERVALALVVLAIAAYVLALHWFLARAALRLPRWRAAGFVLAVNLGSLLLWVLPDLLDRAQ